MTSTMRLSYFSLLLVFLFAATQAIENQQLEEVHAGEFSQGSDNW